METNNQTKETTPKILLVDDDVELMDIYSAVFEKHGYDVVKAVDGQEAWEFLNNGYMPDIILTGIMMPRMKGFKLIERMRADARFAGIPIAISSHRGLAEDRQKAESLNVLDFIVQGQASPNEVVRRIGLLLGKNPVFKVSVSLQKEDGKLLQKFVEKEFHKYDLDLKELMFELKPKNEKGVFSAKLVE